MPNTMPLPWSFRLGVYSFWMCLGISVALFSALVLEWPSSQWSRLVLGLLVIAGALALLLWRSSNRRWLVVYPIILAISVYLWDTTLPPPTLPEGMARLAVPLVVLLAVTTHWVWMAGRMLVRRRSRRHTAQEYMTLARAAILLKMSHEQISTRLRQLGGSTQVRDGQEYIAVDDLCDLVLNAWLSADIPGPPNGGE